MLKKFIYKKLKRALEKKASSLYKIDYKAIYLTLEGFHASNILLITVAPENGDVYTERLKLDEHSQQLDLFLSRIKKLINNFDHEIYSKIKIDFVNFKDEISLTYADKDGIKRPFNLTENF